MLPILVAVFLCWEVDPIYKHSSWLWDRWSWANLEVLFTLSQLHIHQNFFENLSSGHQIQIVPNKHCCRWNNRGLGDSSLPVNYCMTRVPSRNNFHKNLIQILPRLGLKGLLLITRSAGQELFGTGGSVSPLLSRLTAAEHGCLWVVTLWTESPIKS